MVYVHFWEISCRRSKRKSKLKIGFQNNDRFDEKFEGRPQDDLMMERLNPSLVKMRLPQDIKPGLFPQTRRPHLQDYSPADHKKEEVMGTGIMEMDDFFDAAKVGGL